MEDGLPTERTPLWGKVWGRQVAMEFPQKEGAFRRRNLVGRRRVKNDRLNHAGHLWAFASLKASPGANAHYRRRRERGDWHAQAQRHLVNRMIGQLFHCLQ